MGFGGGSSAGFLLVDSEMVLGRNQKQRSVFHKYSLIQDVHSSFIIVSKVNCKKDHCGCGLKPTVQGIYHHEEVDVPPRSESDDDIPLHSRGKSKNGRVNMLQTTDRPTSARSVRFSGNQLDVSQNDFVGVQNAEQSHDAEYQEALNLPSNISYPPSSPPAYQSPRQVPKSERRKGNGSKKGTLNDLIMSKVTLPFQQMMRRSNNVGQESESDSHEDSDPDQNTAHGFNSDELQLLSFIDAYQPEEIRPRPLLRPFVMDYIPAIGDIDAMIKIPRPDEVDDNIGLIQLDEPAIQQSDPTILAMQLRHANKEVNSQLDAPVKQLERGDKSAHEIDKWISDIKELHRTRPSQSTVQFRGPMPDIESLMQEFHPHFEQSLEGVKMPSADLDVNLEEYADICLNLIDIPVSRGRIQSLHCFFSLYREFRNSQHFKNLTRNVSEKRKTIDRMEL
ncbi:Intraflagellar transport complex B protein 46 C terminal [Parelaphostrongylus tenuis]|uniref:Intraflagellar transport protein 46 homolog n=1 Tax=Parelaphostrongylus tenuis TaxID=148309 RepID=A0AAD5REG4_PARTN|nr:Intraflagellar transport complex B protein 46 C terminal [Parelaphostrongylus tenuis]